jgi:hypothetical protein
MRKTTYQKYLARQASIEKLIDYRVADGEGLMEATIHVIGQGMEILWLATQYVSEGYTRDTADALACQDIIERT